MSATSSRSASLVHWTNSITMYLNYNFDNWISLPISDFTQLILILNIYRLCNFKPYAPRQPCPSPHLLLFSTIKSKVSQLKSTTTTTTTLNTLLVTLNSFLLNKHQNNYKKCIALVNKHYLQIHNNLQIMHTINIWKTTITYSSLIFDIQYLSSMSRKKFE